MASGPITSWQIDGETMETVTDFIFWGSKVTADGDCSHELKNLLLGRKAMTNLDSMLKSRDIILPTKVHLVSYGFFWFFVLVFVIHWQESAMDLHVFPIPIPPPSSLSTRSLWVFPVHQVRALVSCIQPGLVICFTLDNIYVSMLFSWNIPHSPSPTESKSLFYTSVSLFLFCI